MLGNLPQNMVHLCITFFEGVPYELIQRLVEVGEVRDVFPGEKMADILNSSYLETLPEGYFSSLGWKLG